MEPEEYTVQVPTTYTEYETKMVPKEIEEVKIVQKPFEIEVPVEKVRHQATRIAVPDTAENYYEHSHVDGDEEHQHGAAIDPSSVDRKGHLDDDCSLITCPDTLQPAWMGQDGLCYCGHGAPNTYKARSTTGPATVAERVPTATSTKGNLVGFDLLHSNAGIETTSLPDGL